MEKSSRPDKKIQQKRLLAAQLQTENNWNILFFNKNGFQWAALPTEELNHKSPNEPFYATFKWSVSETQTCANSVIVTDSLTSGLCSFQTNLQPHIHRPTVPGTSGLYTLTIILPEWKGRKKNAYCFLLDSLSLFCLYSTSISTPHSLMTLFSQKT